MNASVVAQLLRETNMRLDKLIAIMSPNIVYQEELPVPMVEMAKKPSQVTITGRKKTK